MRKNVNRLGKVGDDDEPAIEILNLVVPKPDIPHDIAQNYKKVKVQWTEQLVATQEKKLRRLNRKRN